MTIKKIVISPPFGRYLNFNCATSIVGSYTTMKRPGLCWQVIKTLRPTTGGWINKIGLRNSGIHSIKKFDSNKIYSIVALEPDDYQIFLNTIPSGTIVEINLGCPNTEFDPVLTNFEPFLKKFSEIIIKVPPINNDYPPDKIIPFIYSQGIRWVHISNTIPTENGGISGTQLKPYSLKLIRWVRSEFPDMKIIGGGGIYKPEDVDMYYEAGADVISLATIFLFPLNVNDTLSRIIS